MDDFSEIEGYMLSCMKDSAHDAQHIYRVLGLAVDIAEHEGGGVDMDILTAACLLHDIGREEQFKNPAVCHAEAGSEKAYAFLMSLGWSEGRAAWVRDCILTHRYRADRRPVTIEAKILFDADKLDVTGAIGIARTLYYGGHENMGLYSRGPDGLVLDGDEEGPNTFLQEYRHKLEHIGDAMYTARAREIATLRAPIARAFYESLLAEIRQSHGL
ncbi:conserved hypothetical protein [uncultured Eubacteriales bacterium]|uniref:HD/PDEase domain-containing protein n=1 Tax=uncultured Eubacteriales bacterium TaxID=172733 RepID=A0A212KLF3_9FIRM|nr:conserved hypothetical protein [uncultured Eubacteriales bacterium]